MSVEKYRPSAPSPLANSVTVARESPWEAVNCSGAHAAGAHPTLLIGREVVLDGLLDQVLGGDGGRRGRGQGRRARSSCSTSSWAPASWSTTVVSATLVATDTGAVDGAEASSLLHPATTSAAKPKATSRFMLCTHRLRSASWTLPPGPVVSGEGTKCAPNHHTPTMHIDHRRAESPGDHPSV